MNIEIILLAFAIIINALHISYIYKELSKRIDRERILTTKYIDRERVLTAKYIDKNIADINYKNGVDLQNLINDIKSGKLKKETNKKKQD